MNPDLQKLQAYPFERLARLKANISPAADKCHIALSIGEPKHAPPDFVSDSMQQQLHRLGNYPVSKGIAPLRQAAAQWLIKRFQLPDSTVDAEKHILPVNGTREALFAFAQAVIDRRHKPVVVMPNPFYQIYEGACLLAGAEPYYLNTTQDTGFLPDFDSVPESVWKRCQLIYICSPGNPTGAVMGKPLFMQLMELADRHDFVIASDECYSEIYFDEQYPPLGLLQAAAESGRTNFKRCVVFHSLSKRSNVPGLRSGFVAGDADIIRQFLLYRTYHGCAMPEITQYTSIGLWQDESHVLENRQLYRKKFDAVHAVLSPLMNVDYPQAAFYLWPQVSLDDETFARELFAQQNVTVLPGTYLSREAQGVNPGKDRVRIALVADETECLDAAHRIKEFIQSL